jgi:hypothetical protein
MRNCLLSIQRIHSTRKPITLPRTPPLPRSPAPPLTRSLAHVLLTCQGVYSSLQGRRVLRVLRELWVLRVLLELLELLLLHELGHG